MSTAKMAELLEKTEKWDPITPQLIESLFKTDSRGMESLGKRWNIPQLEQDARYNQNNPEEGIANASKATALGFLGAGIGNLFSGAASQGVPAGFEGTMEAGLMDTGYTPSSLLNAARFGPGSGQGMGQTLGNWAGNKAANLMHASRNNRMGLFGTDGGKQLMMRQGLSMMQPQEPPPPPPQPPQQMPTPYLTEEEKQRLRMQGYQIY